MDINGTIEGDGNEVRQTQTDRRRDRHTDTQTHRQKLRE